MQQRDPNAGFFALSDDDQGHKILGDFLDQMSSVPGVHRRKALVDTVAELMRRAYQLGLDAGVVEQITTVQHT